MRTWSMPQGTIHSNGWRSLSTFTARPWVVTPRETCTPIEPILRSPAQTPVRGLSRASAAMPSSRSAADHRPLERPHEPGHAVDRHDRVGHELAGAVVGHAPAAVGVLDADALEPVPVLAHGQVGGLGPSPARVYGRVLEHEQDVRELARLAQRAQLLLELRRPRDRARDRAVRPRARPPFEGYPALGGPKRALLADPRSLAAARRLDVADVRGAHAARRPGAPPAAAGGHRGGPRPGHPDRRLRQPRAGRRRGPVARAADLGPPPGGHPGGAADRPGRGAHRPRGHRPARGEPGRRDRGRAGRSAAGGGRDGRPRARGGRDPRRGPPERQRGARSATWRRRRRPGSPTATSAPASRATTGATSGAGSSTRTRSRSTSCATRASCPNRPVD